MRRVRLAFLECVGVEPSDEALRDDTALAMQVMDVEDAAEYGYPVFDKGILDRVPWCSGEVVSRMPPEDKQVMERVGGMYGEMVQEALDKRKEGAGAQGHEDKTIEVEYEPAVYTRDSDGEWRKHESSKSKASKKGLYILAGVAALVVAAYVARR
jgi:hypothetical protein